MYRMWWTRPAWGLGVAQMTKVSTDTLRKRVQYSILGEYMPSGREIENYFQIFSWVYKHLLHTSFFCSQKFRWRWKKFRISSTAIGISAPAVKRRSSLSLSSRLRPRTASASRR